MQHLIEIKSTKNQDQNILCVIDQEKCLINPCKKVEIIKYS